MYGNKIHGATESSSFQEARNYFREIKMNNIPFPYHGTKKVTKKKILDHRIIDTAILTNTISDYQF